MTHQLTWTVLGAGTALPHPSRSSSGHLLRTPSGARILVDAGAGTLWRLAKCGVGIADIDALFFSHAHLDHTLDLQALLFAGRAGGHGRDRDLPIYFAPEMMPLVEDLGRALGKWFVPRGFEVRWNLLDGRPVSVGGVVVHSERVVHHVSSLAYRFEVPNVGSVAYSGDSDLCDGLVAVCKDVDLAVVECSTSAENKVGGHMSPPEVAEVGRTSGAATLALVHRYAELDELDLPSEVARLGFEREVLCPNDGTVLRVVGTGA